MKKLTKIFMGLSIPAATLGLVTTVACSKAKALKIDLTCDEAIFTKAEPSGDLTVNGGEWYINCEFKNSNYILSNVTISVGNKYLVAGEDFSFTTNKVTVKSGKCDNEQVKVDLFADLILSNLSSEWQNTSSFKMDEGVLLVKPGQKITTDNIKISAKKGGQAYTPTYGTGYGQYYITKKGVKLTSFKETGYTFTNDDLGTTKLGSNLFEVCLVGYSGMSITLFSLCGKEPTTLTIKEQGQTKITINDTADLSTKVQVGTQEFPHATFEVIDGAETTATGCSFEGSTLKTGSVEGTVKFKVKSIFNDHEATAIYTVSAS